MRRFSFAGSDVVRSTRLDVEFMCDYSGIIQWGFHRPEITFLAAYPFRQLVFHFDRNKKN